jgi:predicted secreted protein
MRTLKKDFNAKNKKVGKLADEAKIQYIDMFDHVDKSLKEEQAKITTEIHDKVTEFGQGIRSDEKKVRELTM